MENLPKVVSRATTVLAREWLEIFRNAGGFGRTFKIRNAHINRLGFPIITTEVADALAEFIGDKTVVDIGARTGYISAILAERGVNITAVDNLQGKYHSGTATHKWYPIMEIDALEMDLSQYEAILLSWPDYDTDFGYRIISKMSPGQILIYQGESWGGCTGDENFFSLLDNDGGLFQEINSDFLNDHHVQFDGLHDWWWLYKRV